MILEVCVDSFSSTEIAVKAGANRIELCSALNIGGLTPSVGLMKQVKAFKDVEIFAMIRPRSGDFLYDSNEFETMKLDIEMVKEVGLDGIVTGILKADGKIDIEKMQEITALAFPLKVVLHRAFDDANDPISDMEALIDMGIVRILTSGQRANAFSGALFIKELEEKYGKRITIMPGCGVNAKNIKEIYDITSCDNYHLSGKLNVGSKMEYRNCIERMNTPESEFVVEQADYELIKNASDVVKSLY